MTANTEAATRAGIALAEKAAKWASDIAVLGALYPLAATGQLGFIQDPERFINDVQEASWRALTWKSWATLSKAAHELEFYGDPVRPYCGKGAA